MIISTEEHKFFMNILKKTIEKFKKKESITDRCFECQELLTSSEKSTCAIMMCYPICQKCLDGDKNMVLLP